MRRRREVLGLALLTLIAWACDEVIVEVAPVASVTIEPAQPSLYKGAELPLEATVRDSKGRPLRQRTIEWSVEDPTVASMAADGTLRALEVGETAIHASSEGTTGSAILIVPNREPEVDLTAPAEGSRYIERDSITFEATATDPDDGRLGAESLVWTSDLDGDIGTDTIFTTKDLSVGQHRIVVTATDAHGASVSDSMTVTVVANQPPDVTIEQPADGSAFLVGDTITFWGWATDDADGVLPPESLVWTSDRDGPLGIGDQLVTSGLSIGESIIRLAVRDSHGATGRDSIVVVVHEAPTVTIASPAEGSVHTEGEGILFAGSATDPDDGPLTGSSLVWRSDRDGAIGTGEELSRSDLSPGRHLIELQATDSWGVQVADSVTVTINQPPTVSITAPADGSTLTEGAAISFSGSATDPEDGPLSGGAVVWVSDLDGQIGTDTTFTSASLSAGEHVIRLTATDPAGARGADSIRVVVNRPPMVTIASPADGSTFTEGATVSFSGSATDPEDGLLSGGAVVWASDLDGQIGTGTTFTSASLSAGEHAIRMTATDADGASGTYSIRIVVNQPPTVAITRPADGTTLVAGEKVVLQASAEDLEDGLLSGTSLRWTSSVGGEIGTDTVLWSPSLSVGTHVFRLVATDSHGVRARDSVVINVRAGTLGIGLGNHQFVRIEAGTFQMGDITGNGWTRESPVHTVNITKDFYLQKTEVTHAQWKAVMGYNPSYFPDCGDTCPVESASWNEVQEFIRRLNEASPGRNYRLPTEAEWEYAARAGTTGDYAGTGVLEDMGWYHRSGSTHPAAQKLPNHWGLYDMHGNVWEWVQDWYDQDYYNYSPTNDPQGPNSGTERGLRGGSWYDPEFYSRPAFRAYRIPTYRDVKYGFRLARSP